MNRMNILVIGGSNSLTNQLIRQFHKEGHRVSLLTGSRDSGQKYARVFERYDFPYTSEVLPEVFNSVTPDVTVFTGAYDCNFSWDDEHREAVAYVSAVMNILTAFTSVGKGRFIYVSSDAVFAENGPDAYAEDEEPNAADSRGAALIQAEDICRRMMADADTDILIARLSGYYHLPKSAEDVDDAVSEFCVKYLRGGTIPFPDDRMIMPISESDAVYFLSRLALSDAHRYSCYHISSGKQIRVSALKEMIENAAKLSDYTIPADENGPTDSKTRRGLAAWIQRRIERRSDDAAARTITRKKLISFVHLRRSQAMLSIDRFRDEFGINRLSDFETDIREIVTAMIKNGEVFLRADRTSLTLWQLLRSETSWLGRVLVPVIENIICFVVAYLLSTGLASGRFFSRIDFYLIYVLLFAILYGQHQAILSAFLSTVGFLFAQLRSGPASGVLLDYNTYVWIAQLFILGLAVGFLKDRLSNQKEEALQDHDHMTTQIDDVREINESNVRVKDSLQTQIVNQDDSIGKIYEITSSLDKYNSVDVLFQAMGILREIMGSDDIALYTVSEGEYARLFSATTELAGSMGNSIKYKELGELYDAIGSGRPYINRRMREDMPMMACAIREGDDIRNIIMIWRLPWEKMTLGQASVLTVTSLLIQNAVLRANRFLDMLQSERFIEGTRILRQDAFSEILEAYQNAAKQHLTEYTLLQLKTGAGETPIALANRAVAYMRENDYLGQGADGKAYVLLANTSAKNAGYAIERLKGGGIQAEAEYSTRNEVRK